MKMNRREFLGGSSKLVLAGLIAGGTIGAGKTFVVVAGTKEGIVMVVFQINGNIIRPTYYV